MQACSGTHGELGPPGKAAQAWDENAGGGTGPCVHLGSSAVFGRWAPPRGANTRLCQSVYYFPVLTAATPHAPLPDSCSLPRITHHASSNLPQLPSRPSRQLGSVLFPSLSVPSKHIELKTRREPLVFDPGFSLALPRDPFVRELLCFSTRPPRHG